MEDILAKLLVADNELIKQGTAELRESLKRPEHVFQLVQIIMSSANPEIRQYAVYVLKKRYATSSAWFKLPEELRTNVKAAIIQCLINESDKHTKQSIALFIGSIAKHEFSKNTWPEILQLIERLALSNDNQERLLGIFTISSMTNEAPKVFSKHTQAIVTLINHIFGNIQNITCEIGYYTISMMNNLVQELQHNQDMVNLYNRLLPDIMKVIKIMGSTDPEKAMECLEILDGLCDYSIAIIVNHMKMIVNVCLEIANDTSLSEELRAKSIRMIGWLAKAKKKSIIKHKLIEPIVATIFNLMSAKPNDEQNESYFPLEDDEDIPVTCASETLDTLALNLPPESLVPVLLQYIEPSLRGTDIYKKKAAFLSIAILAEGCSECVRTKYLESFLKCICHGITDPNPVVRNAALFALGQFSEFLQPDVSTYSSELLPVLFNYLQQICNELNEQNKKLPSSDRMFYALEEFCENLELDLLPYLPVLMDRLFEILTHPNSFVHLQELALSAIGAAASACKEHMAPYFEKIIHVMNPYLLNIKTEDEDVMSLKVQVLDTLSVLARNIGKENFAPITEKVLEFALNTLKDTTNSDLKVATFRLCASISTIMKGEIAPVLPTIVNSMIEAIKNSDGLVPSYSNVEDDIFNDNEEEDIENTDEEDDSDDDSCTRYVAGNSCITEKEEAMLALKDIAEFTGEHFNPYVHECFKEIEEYITFPQVDIREAAIGTLTQFVINCYNTKTEQGRQATEHTLAILMPRLSTIHSADEEHKVVIVATKSLVTLLKTMQQDLLVGAGHKETIMNWIKDVLEGETVCQDASNEMGSNNDDIMESEQDEMLVEYAGELMSCFSKVASIEDFTQCFKDNLPTLMNIFSTSENPGRQSFAIGTISECFEGLKGNIRLFPELIPFFMKCLKHSDNEIRSNAIFGIGEMVLHGKEVMYPYYTEILINFSDAINTESYAFARDNIVGAIARLILTNYSLLPMEKIYPIFVQQLPLKQDFSEYKTVFNSVFLLYREGHPELQKQLKPLVNVAISALNEKRLDDEEGRAVIVEFLKCVQRDFPDIHIAI